MSMMRFVKAFSGFFSMIGVGLVILIVGPIVMACDCWNTDRWINQVLND